MSEKKSYELFFIFSMNLNEENREKLINKFCNLIKKLLACFLTALGLTTNSANVNVSAEFKIASFKEIKNNLFGKIAFYKFLNYNII